MSAYTIDAVLVSSFAFLNVLLNIMFSRGFEGEVLWEIGLFFSLVMKV